MNKKIIICVIVIILVIGGIVFISCNGKKYVTNDLNNNDTTTIYDKNGNIVSDISRKKEITEIIENTTIQGIVELNHNGYIYIFNAQKFTSMK